MAKQYVVVDEDNLTSWSDKPEGAERFPTLKAARKRATELAKTEPGKPFTIFEACSVVSAPVGPVEMRDLD